MSRITNASTLEDEDKEESEFANWYCGDVCRSLATQFNEFLTIYHYNKTKLAHVRHYANCSKESGSHLWPDSTGTRLQCWSLSGRDFGQWFDRGPGRLMTWLRKLLSKNLICLDCPWPWFDRPMPVGMNLALSIKIMVSYQLCFS